MRMLFPKNIGPSGRMIRLVIAIILFGVAAWTMSWVFLLIALFVLFESLMSWCVVNHLLGKNSCLINKK